MQARDVGVPILASSAIIVSKPKELEGSIDALRARYSTVHSPTTLSQQIRGRQQEDEAANDEEDTVEFVESLKKGKGKAKPTPSPGVVSSPSVAAAVVPLVEEKKEKEKEQEKETQEQTQEMTTVEAKEVRANTPSIQIADTPKIPATSLVGGTPPSRVPMPDSGSAHAAHSRRALYRFTTSMGYNLDADWRTPTKEKLEKAAANVPAATPTITPPISMPPFWPSSAPLPDKGGTAPRLFGPRVIVSTKAPKKTGFATGLRSMDELNSTKPTTDEKVFPLTGGYLSSHKVYMLLLSLKYAYFSPVSMSSL